MVLEDGVGLPFDALILDTGAERIRPPTPRFGQVNVHVLRSLTYCETIIRHARPRRRVVIVGACLTGSRGRRGRGLDVHVIAPEAAPLAKILGEELSRFIRSVHEDKGVTFHLGRSVTGFTSGRVLLHDGDGVPADFVVAGAGVRPSTDPTSGVGLAVDRGVIVDARPQTSARRLCRGRCRLPFM